VVWLPWLLWAIHRALQGGGRAPGAVASAWIAVLTALVLVSGRLDVAGQVLLVSGLYAVGCMFLLHRGRRFGRGAVVPALLVLAGWGLGFMLAAPDTLSMVEYVETGARPALRGAGEEERPPIGLPAVPQVVLPFMYGSTQAGSFPNFPKGEGNILESPAAGYAGILATLFLAPLAFCSRRHRGIGVLFALLTFFCLSWCFNVPGIISILRLPGLNLMSHNRLTFGAAFSIIALGATGLEVLRQRQVSRGWWFWIPTATLVALAIWGIGHATIWVEPVVTRLLAAVTHGQVVKGISSREQILVIQEWFERRYLVSGLLAGLGAILWLLLWFRKTNPAWTAPVVGLLLGADLLWFGHGQPAQSPPSLYYPSIPVLDEVARAPAGRMIGYACLPAILAQTHGLREIRGYDSVDPARLMDLMRLAADPRSPWIPYALTQSFIPRLETYPPDIVKLQPILNMLNVEYVVFYGDAPKSMIPVMQGNGYWVLVNHDALPRAFVPERVETVLDDGERLEKLGAPEFDPRQVAYVESPVSLPATCQGDARIVEETPSRITVSARMDTSGLVVLADLWDKGWKASVNGRPATIERANHAVRGVVVPAGESTLEFRYRPAGLTRGLWISGFALLTLVSWVGYGVRRSGMGDEPAAGEPTPLPEQSRATRPRRDKRATVPGKNGARGPSSPSTPPRRPGG
jgi:hypothetical protein